MDWETTAARVSSILQEAVTMAATGEEAGARAMWQIVNEEPALLAAVQADVGLFVQVTLVYAIKLMVARGTRHETLTPLLNDLQELYDEDFTCDPAEDHLPLWERHWIKRTE